MGRSKFYSVIHGMQSPLCVDMLLVQAYALYISACIGLCGPRSYGTCGSLRTALWRQFSPSTFMWVLGFDLQSSGLCGKCFIAPPSRWPLAICFDDSYHSPDGQLINAENSGKPTSCSFTIFLKLGQFKAEKRFALSTMLVLF